MSTQTNTNGRVRKTLASQLDRLEAILDTLGDNLPDAIGSAVERSVGLAVKEAVQAVVVELLPALHEQLQNAAPPAPAADTTRKQGLLGRLWVWLCDKVQQAHKSVKAAASLLVTRVRKSWVAAAGVAGVVAYACRTRIASAASTVWGWGCDLVSAAGSALGHLFPRFAYCGG